MVVMTRTGVVRSALHIHEFIDAANAAVKGRTQGRTERSTSGDATPRNRAA
jgi:hypothetical protein